MPAELEPQGTHSAPAVAESLPLCIPVDGRGRRRTVFLKCSGDLDFRTALYSDVRKLWKEKRWDPDRRIKGPPRLAGKPTLGRDGIVCVTDGLPLDEQANLLSKQRQVHRLTERAGYFVREELVVEVVQEAPLVDSDGPAGQDGSRILPELAGGPRRRVRGKKIRVVRGPDLLETNDRFVGMELYDPADLADRMSGSGGYVQVLCGGGRIATPKITSGSRFDPEHARHEAARLAHRLTSMVIAPLQTEDLVPILLTLTHRDNAGETLAQAAGRLNKAWDRLRKRRGWSVLVFGSLRNFEVTRGAAGARAPHPDLWGPPRSSGFWWHAHIHVLVLVRRESAFEFCRWVVDAWPEVTASVAEAAGMPGFGAQGVAMRDIPDGGRNAASQYAALPVGGAVFPIAPVTPESYERFLRSRDANDLELKPAVDWTDVEKHEVLGAIGQVVKYAICMWELEVPDFVEALSTLHGRRLHTFTGGLFGRGPESGWRRAAAEAEKANEDARERNEPEPYWLRPPDWVPMPDLGRPLTSRFNAPPVNSIAPGYLESTVQRVEAAGRSRGGARYELSEPIPVEQLPPPLLKAATRLGSVDLAPLADLEIRAQVQGHPAFIELESVESIDTVLDKRLILKTDGFEVYPLARPIALGEDAADDDDRAWRRQVMEHLVLFRSGTRWYGLLEKWNARGMLEITRAERRVVLAERAVLRKRLEAQAAESPPLMIKELAFELLRRRSRQPG